MIAGYTFILEGALGTLRLQSSGGDIEPYRAIAEMRRKLDDSSPEGWCRTRGAHADAYTFGPAELDPGRRLQHAMMTAMEVQSPSASSALTSAEFPDHFAELAVALDHDTRNWQSRLRFSARPPHHPGRCVRDFRQRSSARGCNRLRLLSLLEQRLADALASFHVHRASRGRRNGGEIDWFLPNRRLPRAQGFKSRCTPASQRRKSAPNSPEEPGSIIGGTPC
jgi:hypothetical protein